jgi:lactate racemase
MKDLYVCRGHGRIALQLPPGWNLGTFAALPDRPEPPDIARQISQALAAPIASAPLQQRVAPSDHVAVIIEDLTRLSPKRIVLSALLAELERIGVPDRNIAIVIALGTHPFLTAAQIAEGYGEAVARRYTVLNHDCHAADLVPVSRLQSGTAVKINRVVHEASIRIGVGSIFAHPLNGFGGGGKILFPGVADYASIMEHHLQYSFRTGSALGICRANPFYDEVCLHARAGGLDFIVNSILDHNDRFHAAVCGDSVAAHLAGAETCRRIISLHFDHLADATVISAFPYSQGVQAVKPLAPAALITRPGGCIVLLVELSAPFPEPFVQACDAFRRRFGPHLREAVIDHFERRQPILAGAPELNMAMAQLLLTLDAFRIIMVSEQLTADTAERLGVLWARDFDQAARLAAAHIPPSPHVHVVPAGGVILPIVDSGGV